MSEDSLAFRRALGAFATGVAVITTADAAGGAAAITVNSFSSVSLNPRLVLWSLGDQSDAYGVFSAAETWGVSVLGAEDHEIALRFAANGRSAASASVLSVCGGAPVLAGALAAFGCRTFARHVLGDHLLIVGEVMDFSVRPGAALSFYRGRFGAVAES